MVDVAAASPRYALAGEDCFGEGWSVSTRSPSNFGFAFLNTIRTPAANCQSRYWDYGVAAAMKIAPVARNGTGWSDVNQIGDIYTASFTSVGGENCRAFLKLGPPWQSGWLRVVRRLDRQGTVS
jgi:hypothetical protein